MATFSLAKGSLEAFSLARAVTICPCTPTRLRVRSSNEEGEFAGANVLVQELSDQLLYANGRIKDKGLQLSEWKALVDQKNSIIEDLKESRADEKSRLLQDSRSKMRELRKNIAALEKCTTSLEESKRYLHVELLTVRNVVTVRGLFEYMEEQLCPVHLRFRPRREKWEHILFAKGTLSDCLSTQAGWALAKQVESIQSMYGTLCEYLHDGKNVVLNGGKIDIYAEPLTQEQAKAIVCIGEALQLKINVRRILQRFVFDKQEESEREEDSAAVREEDSAAVREEDSAAERVEDSAAEGT